MGIVFQDIPDSRLYFKYNDVIYHIPYAGLVTGEIVDNIRNMGIVFQDIPDSRLYFKYNDVIYHLFK